MKKMAEGGIAHEMNEQPQPEAEEEHHSSITAAIMARRDRLHAEVDSGAHDEDAAVRMANGGIAERSIPDHADDASLEEGEVDIDDNEREIPNQFYNRNEDAALKENYDEDVMHMSQPEDSNEVGDEREDSMSDKYDMISKIRSSIRSRRQFRAE
jgi:hypothetical protein